MIPLQGYGGSGEGFTQKTDEEVLEEEILGFGDAHRAHAKNMRSDNNIAIRDFRDQSQKEVFFENN